MSQSYTVDVYDSSHVGATDLANIENNFAAIKSCFSGASDTALSSPEIREAGMWWYDTANKLLKQRNADNDGWITWFDLDAGTLSVSVGTDSIKSTARKPTLIQGEDISPGSCSLFGESYVVEAGNILEVASADENTTTSTTYVKTKEARLGRAGTYRVKFDLKSGSTNTVYGQIYKDGVALGTERTKAVATYETFSEDLEFEVGDLVQLYIKATSGETCYIENFEIYSSCPITPTITLD